MNVEIWVILPPIIDVHVKTVEWKLESVSFRQQFAATITMFVLNIATRMWQISLVGWKSWNMCGIRFWTKMMPFFALGCAYLFCLYLQRNPIFDSKYLSSCAKGGVSLDFALFDLWFIWSETEYPGEWPEMLRQWTSRFSSWRGEKTSWFQFSWQIPTNTFDKWKEICIVNTVSKFCCKKSWQPEGVSLLPKLLMANRRYSRKWNADCGVKFQIYNEPVMPTVS